MGVREAKAYNGMGGELRMPETGRFVDTGEWLLDFAEEYLVVCPACRGCARVLPRDPEGAAPGAFGVRLPPWVAARRLVCVECGLIRETDGLNGVGVGGESDGYFGEPLWLRTPCCGETLWAINRRHLERLEAFVGAKLREQERDPQHGWSNRSMANRLLGWMKAGKNRAEILRAIEKLKERRP